MTAGAFAVREGSDRLRAAVRADAVALGSLGMLCAGLVAATWGTWGDLDSDTGYDVVSAALVAHGQLPYVDFTYWYGPLAPFLGGLVSWLGGGGIGPAVALGLVLAAAIVFATYALARSFVGPVGSFLAAGIVAAVAFIPNNYSYVLPHTLDATLGTLLLLGLLLSLRRLSGTGSARWATCAGVSLGLLALTKPEPALAGAVAAGAWIVVRWRSGRTLRRDLGIVAGAGIAIPLLVYGSFLAAVSPHTLLYENLYPADTISGGGDVLLRARMPLTLESFAELAGRTALYAAGAAGLVLIGRLAGRLGPRLRRPIALAVVAGGLVAAVALVANPEALRTGLQWVYGWIPAGVALAVVVLLLRRRRGEATSDRADLELAAVLALAVVAATAYAGFYLHAFRPQMAVYYAPLIAVFLADLHLRQLGRTRGAYVIGVAWLAFLAVAGIGLTLKDSNAESATVQASQGSLAETPAEAELYRTAVGWIERETQPGERILVLPLLTGLEALSGREPALPELSVLPGVIARTGGEEDAIARLEADPVRLVVTDDRPLPAYGHHGFGDGFGRDLAAWIEENYDRAATVSAGSDASRTLTIWTRRSK